MTKTKLEKAQAEIDRLMSLATLREWLSPGSRVYARVEWVSRDGMSRRIGLYAVVEGRIMRLSYRTAQVLGYRLKEGAVVVGGAGMDMAFHVVYCLSQELHGNGYVLRKEDL